LSFAWRLLILRSPAGEAPLDPGFSGEAAWNMAVDEALLDSLLRGESPPTLRLYGWDPPAVSLGRFQPFGDSSSASSSPASRRGALSPARCESLGLPVVRRLTGGRAILHDSDVTYGIVMPHEGIGVVESYRMLSEGLRSGLERLGVRSGMGRAAAGEGVSRASCFAAAARSDLILSPVSEATGTKTPVKLAGSAQYRRGAALLQQGAIPLRRNHGLLASLFGTETDGVAGLAGLTSEPPTWERVAEAISDGFRELWGRETEAGGLTEREAETALRLRSERYLTPEWTLQGTAFERGRSNVE
jgi:lipoate-protein ligase A